MKDVIQKPYRAKLPNLTRLPNKFLMVLAVILICFSGLAALFMNSYQKRVLEGEALQKTEILMSSSAAVIGYVRQVLRPKMYEKFGHDSFIVEAMSSSFISREIMEHLHEELPEFDYRRVAIKARNPQSEANPQEVSIIDYFNKHPGETNWQGIIENEGMKYFMRFIPVRFGQECLHCHGDPEDAPPGIVERYGREAGFHRDTEFVSSVVSISVPVENDLIRINEVTVATLVIILFAITFLYLTIWFFFNHLIVQNLHGILEIFWGNLKDNEGKELLKQSRKLDEIDELTSAALILSDHIQKSQQQLQDYTDKLLQGKELLQSVFNAITDDVVLLSGGGSIKMVNKSLLEKYDIRPDEVLGHPIEDLAERFPVPFQIIATGVPMQIKEPVTGQVSSQDGSVFEILYFPVSDDSKEPDSIVCYVKDITHQKQAEQNIQQTEKMVSIGQLAAGIAHEINNPLGIILCYANLLKDDLFGSPKQLADLGIIEKHAQNCQRIVSDLLQFARIQKTQKVPSSINDCIRGAVEMTAKQFNKVHVAFDLNLQNELPIIEMDAGKLKQVLVNMFINASQAIKGKGKIKVATIHHKDTAKIQIIIEDNGQGIDRQVLDKIFDPFFTTKEPGEGTGLGLSLSYGIIQEHNGDIHVESTKGQGTRFVISLPA